MAQKISEIMTHSPVSLDARSTAADAAQAMKEQNIGDVIVLQDDKICGLVTDRDLVVRVIAAGRDPATTRIGDVCSRELAYLAPNDDVDRAVQLVRRHAVRRIPVVEEDKAVGVVSIGDLALERDERSALADVSAAVPNK
jgi:signal-transduction protein with cAMP-binding, CBS, and nucleotidyltransferase domain